MNYNAGYQIKFGHKLTPVIKWLISINAAIFIFQMILKFNPANYRSFIHIFGLVPVLINNSFRFWQFFTYMFLHGSLSHIFFNMFGLWMFGCEIESKWGGRKFLLYYIITGIGAGISTYLFSLGYHVVTIGASGSIYGILMAYGVLFPNRKILLFFFLPVRAIYIVLIYGILEFFASFGYSGYGIAHFAHLGGMVVGFFYLIITRQVYLSNIFSKLVNNFILIIKKRHLKKYVRDARKFDFLANKISLEGVNSLSHKEREFLDKFNIHESDDKEVIIH